MAYYYDAGQEESQHQFIVETIDELDYLPTTTSQGNPDYAQGDAYNMVQAGSKALCLEDGTTYVLTDEDEWIPVQVSGLIDGFGGLAIGSTRGSSGGSGGGISDVKMGGKSLVRNGMAIIPVDTSLSETSKNPVQNKAITNEVNYLSYQISSISNSVSSLGNSVITANNNINNLSSSLSSTNSTVTTLSNTVSGVSSTVTTLSNDLTTLDNTVSGLSDDVDDLTQAISGIETLLAAI